MAANMIAGYIEGVPDGQKRALFRQNHSHSIVPGGFEVMS